VPRCDCAGTLLISDSESFLQQKVDRSLGVGLTGSARENRTLGRFRGAIPTTARNRLSMSALAGKRSSRVTPGISEPRPTSPAAAGGPASERTVDRRTRISPICYFQYWIGGICKSEPSMFNN
jgi:hypothetical protein